MLTQVKLVYVLRDSQSLECTNMHFESQREAGGFGYGMVLSPWSYLVKLLPRRKLMFLLS